MSGAVERVICYSLCIGINTYPTTTGLASLDYAENDAQNMDKLLGRQGFAQENRRLFLGKEATLDAINRAMGEILLDRPQQHDLIIFYFAGHSIPIAIQEQTERQSEVFLATYDFDYERIQTSIAY